MSADLRVAEIRDRIMAHFRAAGGGVSVAGGRIVSWGRFTLLTRTPFSALAIERWKAGRHVGPRSGACAAARSLAEPEPLAYGLEMFCDTERVLAIEWTQDDRQVELRAYRPGEWEAELIALIGGAP